MKKLLIVLSIFILISCNDSENSITNPDPENPEAKGSVALTFSKGNPKSRIALKVFPDPTNVRVLIRRFSNNDLEFNALADVEVPTDTTIMVEVPARDNYQIDAFSYIDSTSNLKPILKVDQKTGVSVVADEVTQVTLKLEPVSPTFSIPDTVTKGDNFSISATFDNFLNISTPQETQYLSYLHQDSVYSSDFNNDNSDYFDGYTGRENDPTLEWDEISISEYGGKQAYFQITSKLSADQFYKNGENKFSFILNYPNPYITDSLKTFVKIPEGGIGIGVEY